MFLLNICFLHFTSLKRVLAAQTEEIQLIVQVFPIISAFFNLAHQINGLKD